MQGYQFTYDQEAKKFDSQYLIALADKHIYEQDFKDTMTQASTIFTSATQDGQKERSQVLFTVRLSCVAVLMSVVLGTFGLNIHGSDNKAIWLLAQLIIFVIGCIVIVRACNKLKAIDAARNEKAKEALKLFLDGENATKYLSRGVQFLAKYSTSPNFNEYKFEAVQPEIWIIFCENVGAIPYFTLSVTQEIPAVQNQESTLIQQQYYVQEQPHSIQNVLTRDW
jgi:hypothetical protein